ncbi:MAG: hypothetical protein K0U86_00660 [Planctomycetes bacterium]|nr:hypothetical protein [Planctomycetota bacterium]MCH9723398.1 hypothetical protein [Planctomycetota bacterium]MCH9777289.1 hypothetical protein [Planctomycetota bacterium]
MQRLNFCLTRKSLTPLATLNERGGYGELPLIPKEKDAGYYPVSPKYATYFILIGYLTKSGGGGTPKEKL